MRRVIVALFTAGLALGVVLLWPDATADDPPTTEAVATTSTTTTLTTTSALPETTTTSTSVGSHVVTTVEEAEEILRELWFGWFEGIYNQDEERIREVVVLEETVETAKDQFGVMEFTDTPAPEGIELSELELLRSDDQCIAVWSTLTLNGFRTGVSEGVYILRRVQNEWKRLSTWIYQDDLWEADCDSLLS